MPRPAARPPADVEPIRFHLTAPVQTFLMTNLGLALVALVGWVCWGFGTAQLEDIERVVPQEPTFEVDLNSAEWPELAQLPGIGQTLGRRIVERRRRQGPFKAVDDLIEVHGIGPRILAQVRPWLVIGEPGPHAKLENTESPHGETVD